MCMGYVLPKREWPMECFEGQKAADFLVSILLVEFEIKVKVLENSPKMML